MDNGIFISAVIKAKNEEKNIAECLHSLDGVADELIVVNDASSDATKKIAHELGAIVIDEKSHNGLINVLDKIGFESARGDWLLRLDADERMTPTLAQKLRAAAADGRWTGVRFARKNFMFGSDVKHGGWFRADQLRFFRRDCWDKSWTAAPHTQPFVSGSILTLPPEDKFATVHYDYDSVEQFIHRTLLNYAKAEAVAMRKEGRRFSVWRLLYRPPKVFFGRLLIRSGWRDGMRGVVLAGLLACYAFLIEAILWDLERTE